MLNKNKTALAIGLLFGIGHLVWVGLVAVGIAKPLMDWVLSIHFISMPYEIEPFAAGRALILVLFTGAYGCVLGWCFAAVWNIFHKKGAGI